MCFVRSFSLESVIRLIYFLFIVLINGLPFYLHLEEFDHWNHDRSFLIWQNFQVGLQIDWFKEERILIRYFTIMNIFGGNIFTFHFLHSLKILQILF
jgi:hypothetical protein